MKRPAAFFDFDKTLITADSAEIGVGFLWKEGHISLSLILRIMVANQLFKRGILSIDGMTNVVLQLYRGKQLQLFRDGVPDFYRQHLEPRLSPVMLARLEEHRRQEHCLVLLSASVRYMLEEVFHKLSFDHLVCTDLEEDDQGILTGKTQGPALLGRHKAEAARRLAEEEGLDLAASFAYGDHHTDIHILDLVGHPSAVNPDKEMLAHARKLNWPVIYHDTSKNVASGKLWNS